MPCCGSNLFRRGIRATYKTNRLVGKGTFGNVFLCKERSSGECYAMKVMPLVDRSGKNFKVQYEREVQALEKLNSVSMHMNIVPLKTHLIQNKHYYIITDYCQGGELFSQIVRRKSFTELEAAKLTLQMLSAVQYCHVNQIVHRDVKAENFLFQNVVKSNEPIGSQILCLIDFGMAVQCVPGDVLKEVCGSPHYVAPEVLLKNYSTAVDVWAIGIIVYLMLFGRYPFEGASATKLRESILSAEPDFFSSVRGPPSIAAINFIQCLLRKDPTRRPTAQNAMEHDWLNLRSKDHTKMLDEIIIDEELRQNAYDAVTLDNDLTLNKEATLEFWKTTFSDDDIAPETNEWMTDNPAEGIIVTDAVGIEGSNIIAPVPGVVNTDRSIATDPSTVT